MATHKLKLQTVLTGGIASGKSTVSKMLAKRGIIVIDADELAHGALANSVSEVEEIFGAEYVVDGAPDRARLGKLIFADKAARARLEELLHPKIYHLIECKVKECKGRYVVDIPLYYETGARYEAETVAVVYASREQQLERLMRRNHLTRDEALMRLDAQMDIAKKREMADIVIDNTMDEAHLADEVERFVGLIGG
jgi:dephospho-CoA kinase